jgi:gas vesicle structural protein
MTEDDELTLLELTDRLLNRGVVLAGEAVISVAGVDLVYLGLNVVLTAVENMRKSRAPAATRDHDGF